MCQISDVLVRTSGKKMARHLGRYRASKKIPGSVLLSHHGNAAVPSAQEGLTAVFGMGTGVAPPP